MKQNIQQSGKPNAPFTRWTTGLALVAGAVLLLFLLNRFQPSEVVAALAATGPGVLWVACYRSLPLALDALGWRELCPLWAKSRILFLMLLRWIGEAVNTLIPVAQVAGGIVRARLLGQIGRDYMASGASTVVDFTVGIFLQIIFTLLGIVLLVRAAPGSAAGGLYRGFFALAALAIAGLVILFMIQRRGLFLTAASGFERTLARAFPLIPFYRTWLVGESRRALQRTPQSLFGH